MRTDLQGQTEISIYQGPLTPKCVVSEISKVRAAFPNLPQTFFDLLAERVAVNGFSDERLKAAVGYLIDNCPYPNPSIANIISFDKKYKIYRHSDVLEMLDKGRKWDDFTKVFIKNKLFYVSVSDKEMYNIPKEI